MMLDSLAPDSRPEHAGLSPADVNELGRSRPLLETSAARGSCKEGLDTKASTSSWPRTTSPRRASAAEKPRLGRCHWRRRLDSTPGAAAVLAVGLPRLMPFSKNGAKVKHLVGVRPPPLLRVAVVQPCS